MLRKKAPMDLLHGPLAGQLLRFTIPIALSSIVQQLFNAADTAVAGRFGSENALAAVGTNTETVALIVALSAGLSVGVNVHVAALIGKGRKSGIPSAIRTAVCLAVLIGLFGLIAGQGAAAPLLRLLRTPDSIFRPAEQYLRIYLLGYPFLLLYDFGAAVLRARGDSRYPFFALMLSGVINVGLNVFLSSCCARMSQASPPQRGYPPCFPPFWFFFVWQRTSRAACLSAGCAAWSPLRRPC